MKLHVKQDILSQLHLWTSVRVLSTDEARKENSTKEGKVKERVKKRRKEKSASRETKHESKAP